MCFHPGDTDGADGFVEGYGEPGGSPIRGDSEARRAERQRGGAPMESGPTGSSLYVERVRSARLGCGIGEVLGIIVGSALAMSKVHTIELAVILGFVFAFALRLVPLFRARLARIVLGRDVLGVTGWIRRRVSGQLCPGRSRAPACSLKTIDMEPLSRRPRRMERFA